MNQHLVRATIWLALCSLAALLATWMVIAGLGDRVWWALPLLYGPRWFPSLALLGIVPALMIAPRRAALLAVAGSAVVLFGLLGFRVGLGRRPAAGRPIIRVLELNADGAQSDALSTVALIREYHPDLVVIAECGQKLSTMLRVMPEYHFHAAIKSLCLVSRGEIIEWTERDDVNDDTGKDAGWGAIVRTVVSTSRGPIRLGLVHLETARNVLDMYLDLSEIPKQGQATRENILQREDVSRTAAGWITTGPAMPTIIAGDFNLPVESAIYRRYWGAFHNAFSETGVGTGYTKHTRRWGIRIDHILSSKDVVPIRSFVGKDVGSDHLPLIADLVSPKR